MSICPNCGAETSNNNNNNNFFCECCGATLSVSTVRMKSSVDMTSPSFGFDEENPFAYGAQSTANASYAVASEIPKTVFEAFRICFREKYCKTGGRACRSEFWRFALFNFLASAPFTFVAVIGSLISALPRVADAVVFVSIIANFLSCVFGLVVFIPSVCVFIRRLHDCGRSGWLFLCCLIPIVNIAFLLYYALRAGTNGPNKFGPKPGSKY